MLLLSSAKFFQNLHFQKILSERLSECQTVWIQIWANRICHDRICQSWSGSKLFAKVISRWQVRMRKVKDGVCFVSKYFSFRIGLFMLYLCDYLCYIFAIILKSSFNRRQLKVSTFWTYNHTTSNLAIYSHETSQDELPEA